MTLMVGSGPFGQQPAGRFSDGFPTAPFLFVEPSPRWMRGEAGGETIVSSRAAVLVHETGRLPQLYFPQADVRTDLLRPSDRRETDALKGEARFWDLAAGGAVAEDAAWSFDHPQLAGVIAFEWDALDRWLEEDEVAVKHVRDPYHRVDPCRSSRHVRVSLEGQLLAESRRPIMVFETGLPARTYLPPEDVVEGVLEPGTAQTACAYKGEATHFAVRVGDRVESNLAWTYVTPLEGVDVIKGYVCFYDERVDVDRDGERCERPVTPWSQPPQGGA